MEILSEDFENIATDFILNWYQENIPFIKINIQDSKTTFNIRGVDFNLIYSIISETIFNALKYSSGDNPIEINWKRKDMNLYYECKNFFSEDTVKNSDSRSGLRFITHLVKNMENVKFERVPNVKPFISILEIYNIGDF